MKAKKKKSSAPVVDDWSVRLLALFKTYPNSSFKAKEIVQEINLPKNDYLELRKKLRELVRTGEIVKLKKNRFALATPAAEICGPLRVNSQGYGFVTAPDGQEIFINSRYMGQALHKDKVRVRLLAGKMGVHPEGQVLEVMERARSKIVGTFHRARRYAYVIPDDIKIQKDIVLDADETAELVEGQKVVVTIDAWEHHQLNPLGKVIEVLGHADDPGVDVLSIVHGYDLNAEFPMAVHQAAEQLTDVIPAQELARRVDLRKTISFTIDPEDAKDFDDAVSLESLHNGHWRLGVHIADVGYYVSENSIIDREAQKRGTSIYLVDRVIPMLPEKLSTRLCSLTPGSDKLCYSALMEVTAHGEVVNYEFKHTLINSHKRFSYEEAQQVLDGRLDSPFKDTLQEMLRLSKNLLAGRQKRGSIDFDTPEVKVVLNDAGKPIQLLRRTRLDTHRLIEEFMLLANRTVAQHIGQTLTQQLEQELPFVYRVHDKPARTDVQELLTLAQVFGIQIAPVKRVTSHFFQRVADQFKRHPAATVLQNTLLRTMMKAKYSTENLGHFGLAYAFYTHFTSPIRRYPDLMVHRLLDYYLADGPFQKNRAELEKQCQLASENEIRAQEAERASIKMKQLEFLETHLGEIFTGFISRIVSFGFFVTLPEFLVDGLVHISDLRDDYYIYEPKKARLLGERRGGIYSLGDPVTVQIIKINRNERLVDFVLVSKETHAKTKPGKKR